MILVILHDRLGLCIVLHVDLDFDRICQSKIESVGTVHTLLYNDLISMLIITLNTKHSAVCKHTCYKSNRLGSITNE